MSEQRLSVDDYRLAPSGEGPLAEEWKDKPHRLVYDLCARLEVDDRQREWQLIETSEPPLQAFVVGRGWSEKPYVLAVDAKGRMAVVYFYRYSTGELGMTSAKPIGMATHWMKLPEPPK